MYVLRLICTVWLLKVTGHKYKNIVTCLTIGEIMKWLAPQRPYLIEEAAIAPDITGSGVLAIVKGLWSCPLDWNLASV